MRWSLEQPWRLKYKSIVGCKKLLIMETKLRAKSTTLSGVESDEGTLPLTHTRAAEHRQTIHRVNAIQQSHFASLVVSLIHIPVCYQLFDTLMARFDSMLFPLTPERTGVEKNSLSPQQQPAMTTDMTPSS